MKTIFDPLSRWIGASPLTLFSQTNKAPIAIDDVLNVLQDSGATSVDVLANDVDPEGGPLFLVSASAALGTAVAEADDTVTYTPPAGLSGFDTVIYTISDDLGQTRDGQIAVTIFEAQVSVNVLTDNTMVIDAATGQVDLTITSPAAFAGTYQFDTDDLTLGPINLVPPTISGTVGTGQVLTAETGLWAHDAGSLPGQALQWLLGGADIAGATGPTYTVQSSDIGPGLSVRETQTDSFGQRSAVSAVSGQSFTPLADPALLGWWDASDTGTIIGATSVSSWTDKASGAALAQPDSARRPTTGTRTLNGLNVLDFNGATFLESARTLPANGDVAFHMALMIDGANNSFEAILSVDATNDFQIDAESTSQFDGRLNVAGIGSSVSFSGGPFSGGLILSAIFDATGTAAAEVFVANTLRGSAGYTVPLDASAVLAVMANRAQNAWADGAVGELIVTGDTGNRSAYHGYLAAKWGLT